MLLIVLVLLLAIVLGGVGFVVHALWWIALAVLVLWILGFVFASGGRGGGRWYRW
ncbi:MULTISPECIES: hydrophobic protein [Kitasatospora]|uniref:Hydrophobic protein n=1 Tax=Kitasatospora cathayae TaxID=3004092 RepID=A0ABY7PVL6_9ACTN|nr:hydrophobic protein [Kitasatospora sp. HUAS 3-15]WBP84477.1 hydrophobic protein [Kitasatospora sp. HUAS 3-15]